MKREPDLKVSFRIYSLRSKNGLYTELTHKPSHFISRRKRIYLQYTPSKTISVIRKPHALFIIHPPYLARRQEDARTGGVAVDLLEGDAALADVHDVGDGVPGVVEDVSRWRKE